MRMRIDAAHDQVDLSAFWTDYGAISVCNNNQGDTVIDLSKVFAQIGCLKITYCFSGLTN